MTAPTVTTQEDILAAIYAASDAAGVKPTAVRMSYQLDPDDPAGEFNWIARISYRQKSRRGQGGPWTSVEGYGNTPKVAAEDAVATYRRAVERGLVEVSR